MNLLLDVIPETVEIDGKEYAINAGFRESILFELLMQDKNMTEKEKVLRALSIYYDKVPENLKIAIEKMLWFYKCGEENNEESVEDKKQSEEDVIIRNKKQIYSYETDADYIYAAFLTQYGIDLQDINFLHWWKFKALFKSLKEENKIVKIMEYRSMTIDSDMSKKEKEFYRSMKRLYALPDNRTEAEKEADFHNSLANII